MMATTILSRPAWSTLCTVTLLRKIRF